MPVKAWCSTVYGNPKERELTHLGALQTRQSFKLSDCLLPAGITKDVSVCREATTFGLADAGNFIPTTQPPSLLNVPYRGWKYLATRRFSVFDLIFFFFNWEKYCRYLGSGIS